MQGRLKAIPKIALLREKAGLTQLELSRCIGVTENTIQNWEKGRAGVEQIERLIKLCATLDCKLEDLIEYVPDTETAELQPPGSLGRLHKLLNTDKRAQTIQTKTTSKLQDLESHENASSD